VARRHGDGYDSNRHEKQGCWWAREINIVTIADDYDAMTSEGPERAYKPANLTRDDAVHVLKAGVGKGRYEARLIDLFVSEVLTA
jgi:HD-GYP domain-containing protein (c-di-GMP phosphodiesterase class II)